MQKKQRIPKNIKEQRTKKAKGASAYDEALYFLTPKARTVREVENRLDECNYSEGEIMAAIDRLRNNGLLNDEKFARDFIESRLNTKPVSRGKLRRQLREHFVENAVIDEALSAVRTKRSFPTPPLPEASISGSIQTFLSKKDCVERVQGLFRAGMRLTM